MLTLSRDVVVTRLPETFGGDVPALVKNGLHKQVREGRLQHVVDLSSSASDLDALRTLISMLRTAREAGGQVRLAAPREDMRRLLAQAALHRVFAIYESVADAVASFALQPARRAS
jgi:anti-sigma B factor antagonist